MLGCVRVLPSLSPRRALFSLPDDAARSAASLPLLAPPSATAFAPSLFASRPSPALSARRAGASSPPLAVSGVSGGSGVSGVSGEWCEWGVV